jgi:hypothetical protein
MRDVPSIFSNLFSWSLFWCCLLLLLLISQFTFKFEVLPINSLNYCHLLNFTINLVINSYINYTLLYFLIFLNLIKETPKEKSTGFQISHLCFNACDAFGFEFTRGEVLCRFEWEKYNHAAGTKRLK